MAAQITVTLTTEELASLACLARRHHTQPATLAGLFLYRGIMDSLTSRLDVGTDAEALREISLGTYR